MGVQCSVSTEKVKFKLFSVAVRSEEADLRWLWLGEGLLELRGAASSGPWSKGVQCRDQDVIFHSGHYGSLLRVPVLHFFFLS